VKLGRDEAIGVAVAAALAAAGCTPVRWGDPASAAPGATLSYGIEITGASVEPITAGNQAGSAVVVSYRISAGGAPASLQQLAAAGVTPSFTLAALSRDPVSGVAAWKSLLRTGSATLAANPIEGPGTPLAFLDSGQQPGAERTGTVEELGGGAFRYRFAAALPTAPPFAFDPVETLRVGAWLGGAPASTGSATTFDFVPAGGVATARDLVLDASCSACHGLLVAHGVRHGVRLCLTCHTVQNADPDTIDPAAMAGATAATNPNPLDLGRLVHRLHRGTNLPTLYQASSNTLPAPPLAAGSAMPLPFFPGRNQPLPGRRFSIAGYRGAELVGGVVVERTDNGQPARRVVEGIRFPRDLRDCDACHGGAPQADERWQAISRRTCAGCHPDAWFGSGATDPVHFAHLGGPQPDDSNCARCHASPGGPAPFKLYADVRDVHVPPWRHPSADLPRLDVVEVTGLVPGGAPTVRFRASDQGGTISPLDTNTLAGTSPVPRAFNRVAITIAGPTGEFLTGNLASTSMLPATEPVPLGSVADAGGQFSYTFGNVLPPGASGTWAVAMEGRRSLATIHYDAASDRFPWPSTGETLTEAASTRVLLVDTASGTLWGGSPAPPRLVVTTERCAACHGRLDLHGGLRHDVEYCVMCHAADQTDWARRPKRDDGNVNLSAVAGANAFGTYDDREERSVHFKVLIHRIHTGAATGVTGLGAAAPMVVYGFPGGSGAANFLGDVRLPGRLADCRRCHVGESYRLEAVPALASPTVANETATILHAGGAAHAATEPRVQPLQAACMSCHDTGPGRAHAARHTLGTVEACLGCHGGASGPLSIPVVHGLGP
jgi:OmcA/MtrC family decaheme c-type cytochrome